MLNSENNFHNISCVELFKLLLYDLFTVKSWQLMYFANKPYFHWGLNNSEHGGTLGDTGRT